MPIKGEFYDWDSSNVNSVPAKEAVFELYDSQKQLLYIGTTFNLHEKFFSYWNSNFDATQCMQETAYYKREFTKYRTRRQKELIEEYMQAHGSKLPPCN